MLCNNKQAERGSPTMACYQTNRPMSFWKDKLKLVSDVRSDTSKEKEGAWLTRLCYWRFMYRHLAVMFYVIYFEQRNGNITF